MSEAGARWLAYPKAEYYVPQHGAYRIRKFEGALYLYGSMEEAQATPALLKIVKQPAQPGRDYAAALLTLQATPEALRALKALDPAGLSAEARAALRGVLEKPRLFEPRANPKTPQDVLATLYQHLGVDYRASYTDNTGRPHPVLPSGRPIEELC